MCTWGMSSARDSTPKLRRGGDAVWLSTRRTGSPCHLLTGNMDTVLVSQPAQGAADTGLATRLRPSHQTPGGPTRQGQPTKTSGFCWKDKAAGVGEGMNIWNNSGRQFLPSSASVSNESVAIPDISAAQARDRLTLASRGCPLWSLWEPRLWVQGCMGSANSQLPVSS